MGAPAITTTDRGNCRLATTRSDVFADALEVIDLPALEALCGHFSGLDYLSIPLKAQANHPIVAAIGPDKAARLCEAFGGDRLPIVGAPSDLARRAAQRRLKDAILSGQRSGAEIAKDFGVTSRWVRMQAKALGLTLPRTRCAAAPEALLDTPLRRDIAAAILEARATLGRAPILAIAERFGVSRSVVDYVGQVLLRQQRGKGERPKRHARRTAAELLALGRRPAIVAAIERDRNAGRRPDAASIAGALDVREREVRYVLLLQWRKRREAGVLTKAIR